MFVPSEKIRLDISDMCLFSWLSGKMFFLFLHKNLGTIFTLSIGTPYLLTILVLKFEIVHSTTIDIVCMAKSVDPDQMPHSAASDLGLHCLQRSICHNV